MGEKNRMPVLKHHEKPETYVDVKPPAPPSPPTVPIRADIMRSNLPGTVISTTPFKPPDTTATQTSIRALERLLKITHSPPLIKILERKIEKLKSSIAPPAPLSDVEKTERFTESGKEVTKQILSKREELRRSKADYFTIGDKKYSKSELLDLFDKYTLESEDTLRKIAEAEKYFKTLRDEGFTAYFDKSGNTVITPPEGMRSTEATYLMIKHSPSGREFTLLKDGKEQTVSKEKANKALILLNKVSRFLFSELR